MIKTMDPKEKTIKAVFNLVTSVKDYVSSNLLTAVQKGIVKIDKKDMPMLLNMVSQLIDAGYNRAHKSLERELAIALAQQEVVAFRPAVSKKK